MIGLALRMAPRIKQRLEQRLELKLELRHPDIPNALAGTNENLGYIAEYMKEQQLTGLLWGGCATKKCGHRKDIDIILLEGEVSKFEEGIDWWTKIDEGYKNGFLRSAKCGQNESCEQNMQGFYGGGNWKR